MAIVKMPDGTFVRFPDDMPQEEIRALIENKYPDAVAKRGRKPGERDKGLFGLPLLTPGVDAGFQDAEIAGQAMSGVNEGISDLASLPATAANAALSIGPAAVNALTGSKFNVPLVDQATKGRSWVPDPGADARDLMETTGLIRPETDDPAKQMIRRVGKEVGAIAPFLGASTSAGAGLKALGSAVGSGTGAAIAQQIAPGNALAEFAGQMIGGLGPAMLSGAFRNATAKSAGPSLDDLRLQKDAAYDAVDNLGVKYTPQSYKRLTGTIDAAAIADNISPTRHPKAFSFIDDIKTRYPQGLSLTEMDQLRQEVRRDIMASADAAERHFGEIIMDEIDDFIAKAGPGDVSAGSAKGASEAITAARELNARLRKTEIIEQAIDKADLFAASTGSGGNINNATRQKLRAILDNPKRSRGFSADELAAIEDVVRQGTGEKLLRLIGKLSPSGNGLSLFGHLAGTAYNPAWAAVPVAGLAAKSGADAITKGKTVTLRALIARGNPVSAPLLSDDMMQALPALTAAQAANQNEAVTNALRPLRANAPN